MQLDVLDIIAKFLQITPYSFKTRKDRLGSIVLDTFKRVDGHAWNTFMHMYQLNTDQPGVKTNNTFCIPTLYSFSETISMQ